MERQLLQMQQQMAEMGARMMEQSDQILKQQAEITKQQTELTELRTNSHQGERAGGRLVDPRNIPRPPTFSGRKEDWERWKHIFMSWIGTIHARYPGLLNWASKQKENIDHDGEDVTLEDLQLSQALYTILVGYCSEQTQQLITQVPDGNGLEVWRMLSRTNEPSNRTKSWVWRRHLMNPQFPGDINKWSEAFHQWEAEVSEFEKQFRKIEPDDKLSVLVHVAPKEIQQMIFLHSNTLDTYSKTKEYIEQYLTSRNLWKRPQGSSFGAPKKSQLDDGGPAPMDIGAVDYGGKGKGNNNKGDNNKPWSWGKGGDNRGVGSISEHVEESDHSHMLFAVTDRISGIHDDSVSEDVYMLIDSGACENVARKGEFEDDFKPLPYGKQLFSVQGTALKIYGKQFPKIRLLDGTVGEIDLTVTDASETLLSVHNLVERDYDVMFRRSGSYLVKDGKKYPLIKKGKRWYLKVGKVWPDEVGDTAQRVAALEGATSSSSSRIPVSEKKQRDYWRLERDLVVRVHVVPRLKMFSPADADDCPVIVGDLEPSRATEAKWVDRRDGDGESFEDHWFGVKNPRASLRKHWTGETVFKLKAQDERDAEPSPDADDAQDDDDLTLWELKERDEAKQQPLMAEPVEPSPAEIAEHSLHHANFEPWCKVCVEGQGKERPHRRQHEDPKEHIIYSDYMYFTAEGKQKSKEEVEKNKDAEELKSMAIVLTAIDKDSQCPFAAQVPHKGAKRSSYAVNALADWIKDLGWKKVTIQIDQESALAKVFEQVQQRMGIEVVALRKSPRYSSQSLADGEMVNGLIAGKVRTWVASLKESYSDKVIQTTDILFPWIVRFVSWSLPRFHINQTRTTPFRVLKGYDYAAECLPFGECALGKYSAKKSGAKSATRWVCGIYAGKTTSSDEHILLTSAGAQTFRTVRRMAFGKRYQASILDGAAGVPWNTVYKAEQNKPEAAMSELRVQIVPEASAQDEVPDKAEPKDSEPVEPPVPAQSMHTTRREAEDAGGEAIQIDADMSAADEAKRMAAEAERTTKVRRTDVTAKAKSEPAPAVESQSPTALASRAVPGEASSSDSPSSSSSSTSRSRSRHSGHSEAGGVGPVDRGDTQEAETPVGATTMEGAISAILEESEKRDQLASVADYLDSCVVDEGARHQARLEEIDKLDVMFNAFTPRDRRVLPKEIKVFGHCWVDKVSNGIAKSRLTCQDFKRNSNEDKNSSEGQKNFCPTPGHSTCKMLEIYSLYHNFPRVKADLTSAFLIARDQGDDKGQPVCMKPPREWLGNFEVWLAAQPEEKRKELEGIPKEHLVWQVDGNIYGRQPAASQYRDRLEEIIVNKLPKDRYDFVRGRLDGCIFRCKKTKVVVIHHIDDFDATGPEDDLNNLLKVELPKHGCKVKVGEFEFPEKHGKTSSEFLGREKISVEQAVLTKPNAKHTDNILKLLGLQDAKGGPVLEGVEEGPAGERELPLHAYCDSDYAGDTESRKSTSGEVLVLGGTVVEANSSTQSGNPATSSGEAELRSLNHCAQSCMYIQNLAVHDFDLPVSTPRIWCDSSAALQAAKRIGVGKMRHISLAHLYVQELVKTKQVIIAKVKGIANPADCLTKHLKTGEDMKQACELTGMVQLSKSGMDEQVRRTALSKVSAVVESDSLKARHKWKPMMAAMLSLRQLCSVVYKPYQRELPH
ncbi:RE2 [Symbiodinium sp. CCMP2592]|nr:RE2 [Symbiodinium sp. CCMP2592]